MQTINWSGFSALWNRVSAAAVPPAQASDTGTESLGALLRACMEEDAALAALQRACADQSRLQRLSRLLRQEGLRSRRRLQGAYFLRTGDTCPLPRPAPLRGSVPALLRACILRAQAVSALLQTPASRELAPLYADLARLQARRIQQLTQTLTALM